VIVSKRYKTNGYANGWQRDFLNIVTGELFKYCENLI